MNPPPPSPAAVRGLLFFGMLGVFLAFWKGDGGYLDLREYLDDAERMWLRGDLSLPQSGGSPRYNRFALGLPFVSGPFVGLGRVVERATGGAVHTRTIIALIVPLLGALACLMLYEIGLALSIPPRAALWTSMILGVGSPLLSFIRLYFTEAAGMSFMLVAIWAYLRGREARGRRAFGWALLMGGGLAGGTACLYGYVALTALLGLGMAAGIAGRRDRSKGERAALIASAAAIPLMAASALLWLNYARYGNMWHSGYHELYELRKEPMFSAAYLGVNRWNLALWLRRVPWLLPALAFGAGLWKRDRGLAAGILAGTIGQAILYAGFEAAQWIPLRYYEPLTVPFAVGLLIFARTLVERWPQRGLIYAGLVLVGWNIAQFLGGVDSGPRSFCIDPALGPGVHAYVWYMASPAPGWPELYGTPMGIVQASIFVVLLTTGIALLALSFKRVVE